ncbi:MAG: type II toxin-antitoxin system Phd/YefM family antitoxin [Clostridia bacterium]|nr:type II toxin-antitoxin system Phd/YefM family antitoxin [Clostridia bacterium]
MMIDTKEIVTMTEANQNFSKTAKLTDKTGHVVIFKNNRPKYLLVDMDKENYLDLTDDEIIDIVAKRVLERYRPAFEALAK